jgi:hypothetical protein
VGSAAQVLYTPPASAPWLFAGSDDNGALLSIDVGRSVRIVAAGTKGTPEVLLDETSYQRSWAFDPTSVVALRHADGVDALVSDDAFVVLVRKQGASVRVVGLAETNNNDLKAMALIAGPSGTLAIFWRGTDAAGVAQKITAVEVDPLLTGNPDPPNLSLATQVAAMTQATRTFVGPAGISVSTTTPAQVWLTTERLNGATDCQATADTMACTGGNPSVPVLDCAWHVDAFRLITSASLQAAPVATVDGRARVHAACGSTAPVGPDAIPGNVGLGPGMSNHHAVAVDPATSRLGLVLFRQTAANAPGLQFGLVDPSGARPIDGVSVSTALAPISNSTFWLAARGDHMFYCYDSLPATCWVAAASGATTFQLNTDVARGTISLPGGLGLVEEMNAPDTSAWLQPLVCAH